MKKKRSTPLAHSPLTVLFLRLLLVLQIKDVVCTGIHGNIIDYPQTPTNDTTTTANTTQVTCQKLRGRHRYIIAPYNGNQTNATTNTTDLPYCDTLAGETAVAICLSILTVLWIVATIYAVTQPTRGGGSMYWDDHSVSGETQVSDDTATVDCDPEQAMGMPAELVRCATVDDAK